MSFEEEKILTTSAQVYYHRTLRRQLGTTSDNPTLLGGKSLRNTTFEGPIFEYTIFRRKIWETLHKDENVLILIHFLIFFSFIDEKKKIWFSI